MTKTIQHDEENKAWFGEEDHLKISQQKTFSQMIFELLSGENPTSEQLQLFDLILNLSIDHGPDTPSAIKVIEAAKDGRTISEAVAEGIKQINDTHGGAIEPAMVLMNSIKYQEVSTPEIIKDYSNKDKRLPGFGHRIYKDFDPRAQLILDFLENKGFGQEFTRVASELEAELEKQKGKKLPLNIDGAIAVVLCTWGWNPKLGKALFIIARTPGLCGQYFNSVV